MVRKRPVVGSARITRSLNEFVPMSIAAKRLGFADVLAIILELNEKKG